MGKKMTRLVAVAHDWGAALMWAIESLFPKFFHKLVVFDIGPVVEHKFLTTVLKNYYQTCFAQEAFLGCTPWPCCWCYNCSCATCWAKTVAKADATSVANIRPGQTYARSNARRR